jgi:hypothetical protein
MTQPWRFALGVAGLASLTLAAQQEQVGPGAVEILAKVHHANQRPEERAFRFPRPCPHLRPNRRRSRSRWPRWTG